MSPLRIGTRGSDLALRQTGWVCDRLRDAHPSLVVEQVIIETHGDKVPDQHFGPAWPEGAFVGALEQALLEQRIDVAVHSYKDLPTAPTGGLEIAAIPLREAPHDVLLTRVAERLEDLPAGARIGTNSPRRAAQIRRVRAGEIMEAVCRDLEVSFSCMQKLGVKSRILHPPLHLKHGTVQRYNRGCRCTRCRKVNSLYWHERNMRRKGKS